MAIQKKIQRRIKYGRILLACMICGLASTFYLYEFFLRVMPSVMMHPLMQTFHIDAKMFGILSAVFFYAYAPMQIPAGLLIDRYGPRLLMTLSVACCTLGVFLFAIATHIYIAALGRGLIGFGSAFAFIGTLVLVARWFPPRYFAFITGTIQLLGCVGAIAGETLIALITKHTNWRIVLIGASILGLVLMVLYGLFIRNAPRRLKIPQIKDPNHSDTWARLSVVCRNPQTWWVALCAFASWAPISILASLWGIPFLMRYYQTDITMAATAIAAVWTGVALASPLVGWWSNVIKRRNLPLTLCYAIGFVCTMLAIYTPHLRWSFMIVLLFLIGVSASSQVITFGIVEDNNPASVEGTAIGLNNMAVIFGGIILQPLIGIMLKLNWDGVVFNHLPVYALSNYRKALIFAPLSSLIGLLTSLFLLRETHCKVQYAEQFLDDDDLNALDNEETT